MKRGLIVDDAAVMRLRLRDIIENEYEIVAEAETGLEAIEMNRKYKPDFITMDITMAEMNGLEALKHIISENPDVKVIMVSAVGQKQNVYTAIENGAVAFIVKPFLGPTVMKAINSAVGQG